MEVCLATLIDVLAFKNPRPKSSQKLSAQERYRIRQEDYRIIYSIQDDQAAVQSTKSDTGGRFIVFEFKFYKIIMVNK